MPAVRGKNRQDEFFLRHHSSYLETTAPDNTSVNSITQVVISGAESLVEANQELPWQLVHGGTAFEFNLELALAQNWALELRLLPGYALEVRGA